MFNLIKSLAIGWSMYNLKKSIPLPPEIYIQSCSCSLSYFTFVIKTKIRKFWPFPVSILGFFLRSTLGDLQQCRHINYESLDAFLCVECGYCAYAHFAFRLTAAVETDFAPVTNEVCGAMLTSHLFFE